MIGIHLFSQEQLCFEWIQPKFDKKILLVINPSPCGHDLYVPSPFHFQNIMDLQNLFFLVY
jgi:hypothetical protein